MLMYHATYRTYLPSILIYGLGGVKHRNWHSSTGDVCLADTPEEAESYAECAPDEGLVPQKVEDSGIVILEINVSGLELFDDPNIDDEDNACLIYPGIISPERIVVL